MLEAQYQECKSKLEENKVTIVGLNQDREFIQMNLDELNKTLTNAYKNKDQLDANIKTKEEEIRHLTIENKDLQLKVSEFQTEAVNLKEQINTKQQAVNNSANNEVHIYYSNAPTYVCIISNITYTVYQDSQ